MNIYTSEDIGQFNMKPPALFHNHQGNPVVTSVTSEAAVTKTGK